MSRDLRFRVWKDGGYFDYFSFYDIDKHAISFSEIDRVEQYTGLTDITGEKIYEGDIVKQMNYNTYNYNPELITKQFYKIGIICWSPGRFYIKHSEFNSYNNRDKVEIIGNIHENLELLYGK